MTSDRLLLCIALTTAACERPRVAADEEVADAAEAEPSLQLPERFETQVDGHVAQWGRGWPAFRFHGEIGLSIGGELVLERAYGYRDLPELQRHEGDAPFRIGTLSAHVAVATAIALVDDGVIALDDRVDRWIPDQGIPHVLRVEHLLTHTSGMPSFTQDLAFTHLKHLQRTHADLARGFVRDPLEFEPGTEFAPSNSNSVLLGLLVERATGRAYEEVARTHVLEPLGMTDTHWGSAPEVAVGLVFDEAEHLEPPGRVDPRAFGASGAWISTTRDLHRLYAGLWTERFGGERMRLRWLGDNPYETPYALVETSLEGRAAYVWLGLIDGFNSAVLVVPDDALVITVLGNSEVVPAQDVAVDVARLAYGLPVAEREEPRAVPVPPAELDRAAGEWIVTRASEEMLLGSVDPETFDMLKKIRTEHAPETATLTLEIPDHGRKRMHPRSPGRYFFKDGPQSTARLERGHSPERDVLVLQRDATELRYVRARDTIAKRSQG